MHSRAVLYDYAMSFVGLPYKWGGDDPIHGFDCSGFIIELLKAMGVVHNNFDTTANGLYRHHDITRVNNPDFGVLAFFGNMRATHVSFCLNNTIHIEAGGGGSKTKTEKNAADQNAYLRVRPINSRSDLLGFGWPKYPFK